jgi:alpha-beta hydrolase superfamily lysophospholipase
VETPDATDLRGGRRHRGDAAGDLDRGVHGSGAEAAGQRRFRRGAQVARGFLATLVLLLAASCSYISEKQGELIFRPTKDAWRGYSSERYAYQEHWIEVAKDQKLHAWWAPADDPEAPVVLYLHGARWNLTGSVTRIDRWKQLGFAVFAVDYRGFGKSADVSPTEEFAYEDAVAAWDYLKILAPGRKHIIVGHSLGGAIGAELARRRPDAAGLVLEATFTSVKDMIANTAWSFLPVDLILTQNFDTLSKVPQLKMPVLITHGTSDAIVPFEMGERLYQAANSPKRFIKVEGAGHHNLSYVAFAEYRAALSELFGLKKKA